MMTGSDDEETGLLEASRNNGAYGSKCTDCRKLEFENLELKAELIELRKKEGSIAEVI